MLEACVSLRRTGGEGIIGGAETSSKKAGDILCVKKSPAVWGEMEKKYCLITYLDDANLEKLLENKDIIAYPYAKMGKDNYGNPIMLERSEMKVDINRFEGSSGLDANAIKTSPTKPNGKECLAVTDLAIGETG